MKYWAYINNEVLGPYEKEELIKLDQFTNSTLLCPQSPVGEKTEDWKEAASFPEISALISNTSARRMSANPTDSGFNNPFHNFGNIEIKSIDGNMVSQPQSQPQFPSPLDPISLSQIARRQENFFRKEENNEISIKKDQDNVKEKAPETSVEIAKESNKSSIHQIDLPEITPSTVNSDLSQGTYKSDASPADVSNTQLPKADIPKDDLSDNNSSVDLKHLPEITPLSDGSNSLEVSRAQGDTSLPDLSNLNIADSVSLPDELLSQGQPEVIACTGDSNVSDNLSAEKSSNLSSVDTSLESPESLNESLSFAANVKQAQEADLSQLKEYGKKIDNIDRDTEKILALIEKFASNSASKDDISSLRTYLDSKIEILGNRINSFDMGEINSSLKNIESKISSIEAKLDSNISSSSKVATNTPSVEIEKNYDNAVILGSEMLQSQKYQDSTCPTAENKKDDSQQSSPVAIEEKKKIDIGSFFRPVLKIFLSLILIAAIAIAASLALRSAGIIDLTVYMPFIPPAKKAKNEISDNNSVTPPLVSNAAQGLEVSTTAVLPVIKDLSEEVIYFVRTYVKEGGDKTIENIVIEHAQKNKLDSNAITWKASKMTDEIYNVFAEFSTEKMPVHYLFEVDYKNKKIRPANDLAGYIIGPDEGMDLAKKQSLDKKTVTDNDSHKKSEFLPANKKAAVKNRTKSGSKKAKKKVVKSLPLQEKKTEDKKNNTNLKETDEEEYVYEYEDDGEQEYLMPGIPKK